jgi:hypothetical protein
LNAKTLGEAHLIRRSPKFLVVWTRRRRRRTRWRRGIHGGLLVGGVGRVLGEGRQELCSLAASTALTLYMWWYVCCFSGERECVRVPNQDGRPRAIFIWFVGAIVFYCLWLSLIDFDFYLLDWTDLWTPLFLETKRTHARVSAGMQCAVRVAAGVPCRKEEPSAKILGTEARSCGGGSWRSWARAGNGDAGRVGRGCRGQGQMGFLVWGWVSLHAGDGRGWGVPYMQSWSSDLSKERRLRSNIDDWFLCCYSFLGTFFWVRRGGLSQ